MGSFSTMDFSHVRNALLNFDSGDAAQTIPDLFRQTPSRHVLMHPVLPWYVFMNAHSLLIGRHVFCFTVFDVVFFF